jgi:dynein heavy chain
LAFFKDDEEIVKFTSSVSREMQTWPSNFDKPSDLYRKVVTNGHHPPLMQFRSWNLAVPYREQRFAHTPSESIANNYTPTAAELKLKLLPAKKFKSASATARKSSDFQADFQPRFNKKDVQLRRGPDPDQYPPSRPMSPIEQIEMMEAIERETNRILRDPSEIDLERYYFYADKGTDRSMIAALPEKQFAEFYRLISPEILASPKMTEIRKRLQEDVTNDYISSMKRSIVDYILMNPKERTRLKIEWVPKKFTQKLAFFFAMYSTDRTSVETSFLIGQYERLCRGRPNICKHSSGSTQISTLSTGSTRR